MNNLRSNLSEMVDTASEVYDNIRPFEYRKFEDYWHYHLLNSNTLHIVALHKYDTSEIDKFNKSIGKNQNIMSNPQALKKIEKLEIVIQNEEFSSAINVDNTTFPNLKVLKFNGFNSKSTLYILMVPIDSLYLADCARTTIKMSANIMTNVKILKLQSVKISDFLAKYLAQNEHLRSLSLISCFVKANTLITLQVCHLHTLKLVDMNLKHLVFSKCNLGLKSLYLRKCTNVENIFFPYFDQGYMENLLELYLINCGLNDLPAEQVFPNLKHLVCNRNLLRQIPHYPKIQYLNASHNILDQSEIEFWNTKLSSDFVNSEFSSDKEIELEKRYFMLENQSDLETLQAICDVIDFEYKDNDFDKHVVKIIINEDGQNIVHCLQTDTLQHKLQNRKSFWSTEKVSKEYKDQNGKVFVSIRDLFQKKVDLYLDQQHTLRMIDLYPNGTFLLTKLRKNLHEFETYSLYTLQLTNNFNPINYPMKIRKHENI